MMTMDLSMKRIVWQIQPWWPKREETPITDISDEGMKLWVKVMKIKIANDIKMALWEQEIEADRRKKVLYALQHGIFLWES